MARTNLIAYCVSRKFGTENKTNLTEDTVNTQPIPNLSENESKLSAENEKLKEQVTNLSEKYKELDVSLILL